MVPHGHGGGPAGGDERRVSDRTHSRGSGDGRDPKRPRGGRRSGGGSGHSAGNKGHRVRRKTAGSCRRGRKPGPDRQKKETAAGPGKFFYRRNLLGGAKHEHSRWEEPFSLAMLVAF